MYTFRDRDCAHRLRAVGERLGHRDEVGRDTECLRSEIVTGAAEPGDDLVEHEQDAVRIACFADPLQIAFRRHEAAGGAGDRFDEARGDVFRAVEVHEANEIFSQFDAVHAFVTRVVVFLDMRVAHVGDAGQRRAEFAPVVHHARQ